METVERRMSLEVTEMSRMSPERVPLAPGLPISRVVTGLWQIADMERDGRTVIVC